MIEAAIFIVCMPVGYLIAFLLVEAVERVVEWASYRLYLRRLWKEHRRIYGDKR